MARWQPGTAERLQAAALELFTTHGFDPTTTTDIAAAAGVTERTFFRHFSDKREVLFRGQDEFAQAFLDGLENAPKDTLPMALVAAAVHSGALWFDDERRPFSRMRQTVIDANPPLRERERHKLAGLADTMATALRSRGIDSLAARLAAESGATVFSAAFTQWIADDETRPLTDICTSVLVELSALTKT